ncbi:hypothetical protein J8273_6647 [Carpediemonas membranifera]|uniref:Uncharacterized protein n=1 Tax=Carpediemonas membranifera TaxID=201153 RepID=A0A8J6AR04_9EUKA|nr:hypothetical protein J8273_6647 [Carpediemonas membranifera]|eukprot:KAG9392056.1 hypothetical protein J8273_6647 [Carpediemonas membranifera]
MHNSSRDTNESDKTRQLASLDVDSYVQFVLWYESYRTSYHARPFHRCLGGDVKAQALMEAGLESIDDYDPPRVNVYESSSSDSSTSSSDSDHEETKAERARRLRRAWMGVVESVVRPATRAGHERLMSGRMTGVSPSVVSRYLRRFQLVRRICGDAMVSDARARRLLTEAIVDDELRTKVEDDVREAASVQAAVTVVLRAARELVETRPTPTVVWKRKSLRVKRGLDPPRDIGRY